MDEGKKERNNTRSHKHNNEIRRKDEEKDQDFKILKRENEENRLFLFLSLFLSFLSFVLLLFVYLRIDQLVCCCFDSSAFLLSSC